MSVTAITARLATSVWTAATIRFITQTPRMMKNKGNALTIGFVRAFLLSLKISCVKFASKGDFDSIEIRKSLVFQGFSGFCNYSHSTNPIIWDCIFYVFTDKLFANLLMFHLLFLAAQFLSIKIVSQKAEKCNHIPRLFQITSHFSLILFFDMF